MIIMKSGISTACLYPMESENALDILLKYDYKLFEYFINSTSEMEQPFLKEFKSAADFYGAEFKSVHPFTSGIESILFFSDYGRRFIDSLDFYKRYFAAANYLGATIFVLHGQINNRQGKFSYSDEFYFERFKILHDTARECGITLCQENVFSFRSHSNDFLKKMSDSLKEDVDFVFDIKQSILSGQNPFETIKIMGKNLKHVHISDSKVGATCLLPGYGAFDLDAILKQLKDVDYSGDIITEVYRTSFKDHEELEKSGRFMENLLKTI